MDKKRMSKNKKKVEMYKIGGRILITAGTVLLTVNSMHVRFFYVLFGSLTPFWVSVLGVFFGGIIVLVVGVILELKAVKAVDLEMEPETYTRDLQ